MKPLNSLSTRLPASAASICANCKRELSLDSFYVNKTTFCPDKYCKECRKSISRRQYCNDKRSLSALSERPSCPVITQIEDRETRMQLILYALQVVRSLLERKKRRMLEEESLLCR